MFKAIVTSVKCIPLYIYISLVYFFSFLLPFQPEFPNLSFLLNFPFSPLLSSTTAVTLEEQQVPDREQASASAAGEERHESDSGLGRQRGLLVLHPALLQAALHRRHRE